ncbi:MAG: NAD(P)/FAD-dependent oxidoreductase [Planctomycetota bacterium]
MSDNATPEIMYDALIIGGGPTGAVAALTLARANRRVLVVEKDDFPRFHVGESLIPQDMELFADLGLLEELAQLPQVKKTGVEFALGDATAGHAIRFDESLIPGVRETFNVERAVLDDALLGAAKRAGAEVLSARVQRVLKLEDGDTRLLTDAGEVRGRYVIDASGQASVLGRHLKTRRNEATPALQKIAYFGHFENVDLDNALGDDQITMVLCDEGWFWMIPIDTRRVSVGMVLDAAVARRLRLPANRMLRWGIERCPLVRDRLRHATPPAHGNGSISDYSYSCAPYAGPGYFLAGDAATFLDPVFSTGLYLGMEGGRHAAERVDHVLRGRSTPEAAQRDHRRFLLRGTAPFFRMIRGYYRSGFRDLLLNGSGPLAMHRAVIAVLAGQVFPRPAWAVRWRMRLFHACAALQERVPLVPRRGGYSLLAAEPEALSWAVPEDAVDLLRVSTPPEPVPACV